MLCRLIESLSSLAIVASLVLGAPIATGSVLCVGPDGHVAVEPAHNDCCQQTPRTQASTSAAAGSVYSTTQTRGCGDCMDFPAGFAVYQGVRRTTAFEVHAPPSAVVQAPVPAALILGYGPGPVHASSGDSVELALRFRASVVLLI